jgi:hypothetical protein
MKHIYRSLPQDNFLEGRGVIDKLTASRLGHILGNKRSSFVNFQTKKPKGIIRIGCFGDSFTYGDEVDRANDYPSLLQDIFIQNGFNNVQVINFGGSWYGFSQVFIMWKYVGRKYDLDYILLGPMCFWLYRDSKFNHSADYWPHYLHARYILKGDGLELIDVIGDSYKQRMQNYYKFIPRLRYLRFDTDPPLFLRCLIPKGRWLKNPFYYYKGSPEEEFRKIYGLLLSEMADSSIPIILSNYEQLIIDVGNKIAKVKENLLVSRCERIRYRFPYLRPRDHNSPLGNNIVAQQMFDLITGKNNTELILFKTEDIDGSFPQQSETKRLKLSEYSRVAIEIAGVELGGFATSDEGNSNKLLHKIPFVSFIAIGNNKTSILDGRFLPLDFELRDGMALTMRIVTGFDAKEYNIGTIRLLNQGLDIGKIVPPHKVFFSDELHSVVLEDENIKHGAKVTVLLDGKPIMCGKKAEKTLKLKAIQHKFIVPKGNVSGFIDVKKIGESGIVYLSLFERDGKEIKIPFAQWSTEVKNVPYVGYTSLSGITSKLIIRDKARRPD